MNPYAFPPFATAIIISAIGIFVFARNKKSNIHRVFSAFSLVTIIWLFGYGMMYLSKDSNRALFWARAGFLGIIFIPILSYHFISTFLNLKNKKSLVIIYLLSIPSLLLSYTSYIYNGIGSYFWGYYPTAGKIYSLFLSMFIVLFAKGLWLLFMQYRKETGVRKEQIKYLGLGFAVGTLGAIDYLAKYPLFYNIYPFGYICALLFYSIIAYTILRYRLMDINIALTRAGIFVIVYILVLGIPLGLTGWGRYWLQGLFGANWYWVPVILAIILATLGPFIYIYLDRKAEERLLKEQRRYQETLKQASVGMTRIRKLRRLLDLITHIVTKTVKISYAGIYLYDKEAGEYILQVCRDKGRTPIPKLTVDNPLIQQMIANRKPLIYEEVRLEAQSANQATEKSLAEHMRLLTASVVIPSFLEDRLVGFIVLGEKASGQIYTPDDLNVFQILAAQAALAIENARFFEETKQMQEQIGQAEKMATIGTMADGLSHQINNRFYALSLIAGDTIDTIKLTDTSQCSQDVQEMIKDINHALERIKENVIQGGEVVKGILKYTRKGEKGLEPLALDQILDATLDMLKYKINLSEIDIIRGYPKYLPKIKGNQIQLQEVFFNFCDNAYDAINERKGALKEEGYRGRVNFSARTKDTMLEITVEDNGMGIRGDLSKKVFAPFFTTKTSSHKGTGLGLYVIQKIITDNHRGRVSFESTYKVGTRFIVELPLA